MLQGKDLRFNYLSYVGSHKFKKLEKPVPDLKENDKQFTDNLLENDLDFHKFYKLS